MSEHLYRYERLVKSHELPDLLRGRDRVPKILLSCEADLQKLRGRFAVEIAKKDANPARMDSDLAPDVHRTLKHLPKHVLLDMRFWHWMAIEIFPDFVWQRWFDGVPSDGEIEITLGTSSRAERFLGTSSLVGASRNALCRLYAAADRLYSEADSYRWCKAVFLQQDRHTAIFERAFGLYREACLAILKLTEGKRGKETQQLAKRLNHIATTLVVDAMSAQEIINALR